MTVWNRSLVTTDSLRSLTTNWALPETSKQYTSTTSSWHHAASRSQLYELPLGEAARADEAPASAIARAAIDGGDDADEGSHRVTLLGLRAARRRP